MIQVIEYIYNDEGVLVSQKDITNKIMVVKPPYKGPFTVRPNPDLANVEDDDEA